MNFKNIQPTYFCSNNPVNLIQENPVLQLSVAKNPNQFIIYTTHLRSVNIPKNRFFPAKSHEQWWSTIKKRILFSLYFLNGFYRYHKNFYRFEFQALIMTISSDIFLKGGQKIVHSTLSKIWRRKKFYNLVTTGKKVHAKTFHFLEKLLENNDKCIWKSEKAFASLKGLQLTQRSRLQ